MSGVSVERRPDISFGVYLRPSAAMARAQAEIHDLIARQYGSICAGRFMPHATIKGFFRSDASVREMVAALDPVMARHDPFPVTNNGPVLTGKHNSVVLDIHHDAAGARNEALHALHVDVFSTVMPLVLPNCDFTPREGQLEGFFAHLTLMMGDVPSGLQAEILAFIEELGPVGPSQFTAERMHLVAIESDDWAGPWWETMRWTLLHSWQLGGESVPVSRPVWNLPPRG